MEKCYNNVMILITGGTGFISGVMRRKLDFLGMPYRLLVSATPEIDVLKKGETLNLAVSSPNDERGLRAALKDVDIIYHLAGVERIGARSGSLQREVEDLSLLVKVSKEMGVKRFFYLSHLGANRASAFGIMKAKGLAEGYLMQSGLNYTIIRTGLVYGDGDAFTQGLAKLIRLSPLIVFVPGNGNMLTQPLWVDDLVTSLIWSLDLNQTENSVISVGGPEHLSIIEVMACIARAIHRKPKVLGLNPVHLGILTQILQSFVKNIPTDVFWIDYLAENRVTALDSMPHHFGINPARFSQSLDYLLKEKSKNR